MNAEDPKEYAFDYSFWWTRVIYYRLEHKKLKKKNYYRVSKLVTSEIIYLDMSWYIDLDRVKCEVENITRILIDFLADKALLETEDHENLIKNDDYWWSLKNFQKPLSKIKNHEDSITNSIY